MKKNTKGALAAGAAALLLAGGAGTMAAWSDSESLDAVTVTAGQLRISEQPGGGWTWADDGTDFDPANDMLVPGDIVEYTADYTLDVEGENLVASLTPVLEDTGTGALADYLTITADSDTTGITLTNITPENNGDTVSVTTTITFDASTSGQDGMEASANLAGSTITLQQTAPAAP
ncbi:alternate-type signal peptide domain-containing protein [Dietzia alimentaria]|uniref:alternate-type signal peptide domain-containing protein n=1 Tax=Dietzia alimentaria TaxID=665550 RepID=UPI00029A1D21|nr:alternate-type signal peptide domain-containing protein [Dietzia alimentaria]